MKSLWNDEEARKFSTDLDLRVYTSRLLGKNSSLVLHGGGNTSVKTTIKNLFNEEEEVLYVKGSGWDLATIEAAGFAPVKMETLLKMADLSVLSDNDMVKYQRAAMLDPNAPNPSVEAILHAIIPFKFVDHTHADTVVTVSNTANGEERLKEIYGDKVLLIPYVMPGFDLAKLVYEATKGINWDELEGIILLNHGVFTFANDAETSYENMINMITKAERYMIKQDAIVCGDTIKEEPSFLGSIGSFFGSMFSPTGKCFLGDSLKDGKIVQMNLKELVKIRKKISLEKNHAVVVKMNNSQKAIHYSNLKDIENIATQGPLTPDHVIRTKRIPLVFDGSFDEDLHRYTKQYNDYFEENRSDGLVCLNHAPNWAVVKGYGTLSFGKSVKEASIIEDITDHTMTAVLKGEILGGYKALSAKEIFDVEYWELEQAKLKKASSSLEFTGKIVLLSDGLTATQKVCAKMLKEQGATIAAFDKREAVEKYYKGVNQIGIQCDTSNENEIQAAIDEVIKNFGGIDIVISDIGISTDNSSEDQGHNWQKYLDKNVTKHQNLLKITLPYLKEGINPNVVIIASKEFVSVGREHLIYSAVENDQIQLSNKTSQELSRFGIRVNTIYPRDVYNIAKVDENILQDRADKCGLSVTDYLADDELKKELEAHDTAALTCTVASRVFNHTTGAQLKVDSAINN